jgi:hypothetical protein
VKIEIALGKKVLLMNSIKTMTQEKGKQYRGWYLEMLMIKLV